MKNSNEKLDFIIKPNDISASINDSVCAPGPGGNRGSNGSKK